MDTALNVPVIPIKRIEHGEEQEGADLGQTNPTFRERNEQHANLSSVKVVGPIRIETNEESSTDQQQQESHTQQIAAAPILDEDMRVNYRLTGFSKNTTGSAESLEYSPSPAKKTSQSPYIDNETGKVVREPSNQSIRQELELQ